VDQLQLKAICARHFFELVAKQPIDIVHVGATEKMLPPAIACLSNADECIVIKETRTTSRTEDHIFVLDFLFWHAHYEPLGILFRH
jgi:hypothetical protein